MGMVQNDGFHYASYTGKKLSLIILGLLMCLGSFLADVVIGSSGMRISEVLATIFYPDQAENIARVIIWDLRLPVALMGVLVGAALGLSGAVMQTILNNPLASPYTLGLSAAAGFGASVAIVIGLGALGGFASQFMVAGSAFIFLSWRALAFI